MSKVDLILSLLNEVESVLLSHFGAAPGWRFKAIKIEADGFWFEVENERGYLEGVHHLSPLELKEVLV